MKETYTNYNVAVILFSALGSLFSGYSLAVIVATVGQPTWYSSLHLSPSPSIPGYSHTTTIIGAVNGVFFAAGFLGTFLAGWLSDNLGRVKCLRIAALIGILGGAIQTGSRNQAMYIVARIITGLSTGQVMATLPTYYSEVAPPHSRGLMAGAHGSFINMGYAVAGWVGFGCFNASSTSFGWRFPNAVLLLLALLVLAGTFFVPESPRWLVSHDRSSDALTILIRLHHDPSDPSDAFAHQELELIQAQLAADSEAIANDGRWQIFTVPTYRRRLVLAAMVMAGGQNTGVLVINNYNTLLYDSLGLTASQALIVGAAYNTWAWIANCSGAVVSDRLGRRRIILTGYVGAIAMFTIATGLIAQYSKTPSKAYAGSSVAFLFLFVAFYGSCIDVNQFTIATEIFPSHLRAQGTSLSMACLFLADTLWLDLAATAQAKIGWKYYLVFLCLGIVHFVFLWFKLPETANIPLEELDAVFGKKSVGQIENEKVGDGERKERVEGGGEALAAEKALEV